MNPLEPNRGDVSAPLTEELSNGKLTRTGIRRFRSIIWNHYEAFGRKLPWRETDAPYHILVSEIMLQQTQVERVLPKYGEFLDRFPNVESLAAAPVEAVLRGWQGLGYNRRALALHAIARKVVDEHSGNLPASPDVLQTFPGIGHGTASAIAAFAFHQPVVFVETNIRRVFLHFFFPDVEAVPDREILPMVEQTLDAPRVREWYYALMDYGVLLKRFTENPNRRSAHYTKQSRFEGSDRQIRGAILRELLASPGLDERALAERLGKELERVMAIAEVLVREGFLVKRGKKLSVVSRNNYEFERRRMR